MLSDYYQLTKPGIIRGNLITATGGFLLASRGNVDVFLFLMMLLGTTLVIASGCVFNNYIDIKLDSAMERTKKRALVTGKISKEAALIFGSILGILGVFVFIIFTNSLAARVAIAGFLFYVVIYGYWKRRSIYGTLVGSVSGAVPPVIGYTAVSGRFDIASLLLFLVLVAWQMPHFYSIGIYRLSEYKLAKLPILSIVKGVHLTKIHMILYVVSFIFFTSLMTLFGITGYIYLAIMLFVGIAWLFKGIKGFEDKNDSSWAKKMFSYSLLVLLIFSILISIDFALPF